MTITDLRITKISLWELQCLSTGYSSDIQLHSADNELFSETYWLAGARFRFHSISPMSWMRGLRLGNVGASN